METWPGGPRTVDELLPTIEVGMTWDPSQESDQAVFRRGKHLLTREIEAVRARLGRRRPLKRATLERDSLLLYARVRDPHRWTWPALARLDAELPITPGGAKAAVQRAATLVGMALPEVGPGRPPKTTISRD